MDSVTAALLPNQSRNPSKISGVFHRLAKACKLAAPTSFVTPGAVGAKAAHGSSTDETVGSSEETHHSKIHPQPPSAALDEARASCSSISGGATDNDLGRVVLTQLLDAVSSLKLAYLEFQQAHVAYDSEKLRSANESLLSQLEAISDIELFYNEKRRDKKKQKPDNSKPAAGDACATASVAPASCKKEIAEYQSLMEKLHALIRAKDAEALQLRWAAEELRARNTEMEEEIVRTRTPEGKFEYLLVSFRESPMGSGRSSELLKLVHEHTARSIHEFGKPLIGLMKACGWDLDRAADSAMNRMRMSAVSFSQRSHKKYVFEAYLSQILLFASPETAEAESQGGVVDDQIASVMRFQDPLDTLAADPRSSFARFCSSKYLLTVHPAMERSFFGNLDQRAFILRGGHPRTPFYRAFATMARWAWTLKVLVSVAGARMFRVESGRQFVGAHMQSICMMSRDQEGVSSSAVVGFTVVPGFRFKEHGGDSVVVRCKVYVSQ